MINKLKNILLIITVVSLSLIIDVSAVDEHTRVCRYVEKDTKEIVYLKWLSRDGTNSVILHDKNNKNLGVVVLNPGGIGGNAFTWKFAAGCPKYILDSDTRGFVPTNNDKVSYTYEFNGVITESRDVYYSGAYMDGGSEEYRGKAITCQYTLSDKKTVIVRVDSQGKIINSLNADIINAVEFINTIDKKNTCPVTVCYNKNFIRKDQLSFFDDVNHICKNVIGGSTNDGDNRDDIDGKPLKGYANSGTDKVKGDIYLNNYETSIDKYVKCLNGVDHKDKCTFRKNTYEDACKNSGKDCSEKQNDYQICITDNYTEAEIDRVCSVDRNSFENATNQLDDYRAKYDNQNVENNIPNNFGGEYSTEYNYGDADCSTLLGDDMLEWLSAVYFFIQVAAVVITIITGMLGFTSALYSNDSDAMKKAWSKLITRLIITGVIILLPVLVEFILGLTDVPGLTNKNPLCK